MSRLSGGHCRSPAGHCDEAGVCQGRTRDTRSAARSRGAASVWCCHAPTAPAADVQAGGDLILAVGVIGADLAVGLHSWNPVRSQGQGGNREESHPWWQALCQARGGYWLWLCGCLWRGVGCVRPAVLQRVPKSSCAGPADCIPVPAIGSRTGTKSGEGSRARNTCRRLDSEPHEHDHSILDCFWNGPRHKIQI